MPGIIIPTPGQLLDAGGRPYTKAKPPKRMPAAKPWQAKFKLGSYLPINGCLFEVADLPPGGPGGMVLVYRGETGKAKKQKARAR